MKILLILFLLVCGHAVAEEPTNEHEFRWVSDEGLSGSGKTYLINKAFRIAQAQIDKMAAEGKIKFESTHKVTIIWKGKEFRRKLTAKTYPARVK